VLHTRPSGPHATREPLQLGAEIYGHSGLEADLEILELALDSLRVAQIQEMTVDMADARIVNALLEQAQLTPAQTAEVHAALASKDTSAIKALTTHCPADISRGLQELTHLYGDVEVLAKAQRALPDLPAIQEALSHLKWLASHLQGVAVSFDLADLRGYSYYSGVRFAIFAADAPDAVARGGRYDAVGSIFGRKRPAVGFSLDIKALVPVAPVLALRAAVRAPWGEDAQLRAAISALRKHGETVVCVLPGHESEVDEFECDRELALQGGRWVVIAL
jgi:ATP phosphoribosyltransferase regulatory subunit